jgi:hypothetical protein
MNRLIIERDNNEKDNPQTINVNKNNKKEIKKLSPEEIEEIKYKLRNYKQVRGEELEKIIWPYFVKYLNKYDKRLRWGGIMIKNVYPHYFILKNINRDFIWYVNLEDNFFFIKKHIELN